MFAFYLLVCQSEFSREITRNVCLLFINYYLVLLALTRTIISEKYLGKIWNLELLLQENCISLFIGTYILTQERFRFRNDEHKI
jgi:hypothetical protein